MSTLVQPETDRLLFRNVVVPDGVVTQLDLDHPTDAIETLVTRISESGAFDSMHIPEIVDLIVRREQQHSTAVCSGIAIPHCRTSHVSHVSAAIGVTHSAVNFESLDGQPTNVFFLVIVPEDAPQELLKTLAHVALLMGNSGALQRLKNASTPQVVIDVLDDVDDSILHSL